MTCIKAFQINLLLETLGKREGCSERMGSFRFTEHLGKMHRFPVFSEVEDFSFPSPAFAEFPSWCRTRPLEASKEYVPGLLPSACFFCGDAWMHSGIVVGWN